MALLYFVHFFCASQYYLSFPIVFPYQEYSVNKLLPQRVLKLWGLFDQSSLALYAIQSGEERKVVV